LSAPDLRTHAGSLVLANPIVTWLTFGLVLWISHFSPLFNIALEDQGAHDLEHASYLVAGLLFWWPVVGLDPAPRRMGYAARVLYLLLQLPINSFLGMAILFVIMKLDYHVYQRPAFVFTILAAAVVSLLLARYVSAPIVRIQNASRALAAGALGTRVGAPSTQRRDEVGTLARDFDAMAERIQELVTAKEALLRDVSHEFRSPLARIRMALALAERRAGEASRPDLARIEREAERLDALVGQVMTLTRLRTTDAPRRDIVRLDALVGEVVDDARFEYPDATLEYSGKREVSLRGDATVQYQDLMDIIDMLKAAGVQNIGMVTRMAPTR